MLFNSLSFLIFFPIVLLIYFIIPKKLRYIWLLICSYYFYACWNVRYTLLLLTSTLLTFGLSLLINKTREKKALCKGLLIAGLITNLFILFVFKYLGFTFHSIESLFSVFGVTFESPAVSLILPMGISFYIFQAVGYTIDVYRGTVEVERNILKYALFVSFFPQLVAGPIERSERLLPQIKKLDEIELFDFDRIQRGALIMVYGFFLKMVIADRTAILVDTVFNSTEFTLYTGTTFLVAALFFALQIYCDFAGYSYIAIGSAKIMGVEIMQNFNTPYLSCNIKDFWDRWHISLSTWFRDYLYFPLGGSKKGKVRKYVNILIVFLVSGLWHGASWHFVMWGLLHGIMRVISELTMKIRKKFSSYIKYNEETTSHKILSIVITFIIVTFIWIFFRAESTGQAIFIIQRIFTDYTPWIFTDGTLLSLGLTGWDLNVLVTSLCILLFADIKKYKGINLVDSFMQQNGWFRWVGFFVAIMAIVLAGVYGANYDQAAFIYFQF